MTVTESLVLVHMSGPDDGRPVQLGAQGSPENVTIGRVASCAACVTHDPLLSRRHARVFRREGGWWLEDLGSANGTFLGEFGAAVRVTSPVRLQPGQVFRAGQSRFRIEPAERSGVRAAAQAQASRAEDV